MKEQASPGAAVWADSSSSYASLEGFAHNAVNHSAGEYVRSTVHTNSIESFRSLLKRGLYGTCHHMSGQHLQRYLAEFTGSSRRAGSGHGRADEAGGGQPERAATVLDDAGGVGQTPGGSLIDSTASCSLHGAPPPSRRLEPA